MFSWFQGPGAVFREPLPASTNYLGAYDKSGQLLRLRNSGEEDADEEADGQKKAEKEAQRKSQEEEDEEAGLDEFERQQRREAREAEDADTEDGRRNRLPKERASDLMPYPLNRDFRSQAVLSEELREEIWRLVTQSKQDIATVSAVFGVDMRRVAAVVRLKTIEKDWVEQGKKLATPYASAVLGMLPKTPFDPKQRPRQHESINDLPVHPSTRQQIFYPASESRQFTRADAAKVFSPILLPADERIPHPELIQLEKDTLAGATPEQRQARLQAKDEELKKANQEKERRRLEWEAKTQRTVAGQRWDFKFQDINVESAGKDGRGRGGVGWRYGAPHQDRKRGLVKIPTSVE